MERVGREGELFERSCKTTSEIGVSDVVSRLEESTDTARRWCGGQCRLGIRRQKGPNARTPDGCEVS